MFPHPSKRCSHECAYTSNGPMTFLPQDVCKENLNLHDPSMYSDDELESAQSLRSLKTANLRTECRIVDERLFSFVQRRFSFRFYSVFFVQNSFRIRDFPTSQLLIFSFWIYCRILSKAIFFEF